ncbi:hypothetical protein VC191_09440 [Citrobacter koseri]|uniref:antibiotic biosynthesis monooxygenase family protein n=1 Tax=Citrobacter koseri TaxID=545 RepID=UPI002B396C12|nr:hypothetical protein [Citrobacter koseri]MEB2704016.1 hypothetical protein [Citrobacter koseri]MEB2709603.1 hypothetical protein [Citrobacter koseri]
MFMTSFIFEKNQYDDEFYVLDKKIEDYAVSQPGFSGMESYTDKDSGRLINNYYWENKEAMEQLMFNLDHQKAKSTDKAWIAGYQTIIAEIIGAQNHKLSHPLKKYIIPYVKSKK